MAAAKDKVKRSTARAQRGHFAKPGGAMPRKGGDPVVQEAVKEIAGAISRNGGLVRARTYDAASTNKNRDNNFGAFVAMTIGGATVGSLLGPVGAVLGALGGVIGAVHQGRSAVGRKS